MLPTKLTDIAKKIVTIKGAVLKVEGFIEDLQTQYLHNKENEQGLRKELAKKDLIIEELQKQLWQLWDAKRAQDPRSGSPSSAVMPRKVSCAESHRFMTLEEDGNRSQPMSGEKTPNLGYRYKSGELQYDPRQGFENLPDSALWGGQGYMAAPQNWGNQPQNWPQKPQNLLRRLWGDRPGQKKKRLAAKLDLTRGAEGHPQEFPSSPLPPRPQASPILIGQIGTIPNCANCSPRLKPAKSPELTPRTPRNHKKAKRVTDVEGSMRKQSDTETDTSDEGGIHIALRNNMRSNNIMNWPSRGLQDVLDRSDRRKKQLHRHARGVERRRGGGQLL